MHTVLSPAWVAQHNQSSGPAFVTQVLGTGTGQYLADQHGAPFLVRGDSIWALVTNAGYAGGATTYETDIDLYMSTRAGQGFNAAIVDCITTSGEGLSVTYVNGNTWDNVSPWSGSIGTLNSTYWTRVDYAVSSAASNGITVFLNPADYYNLNVSGAAMDGMTTGEATTYGTALAARYASASNIVWLFGNDYSGAYDSIYTNILAALRAGGDTHLVTIENETEGDSRFEASNSDVWAWGTANAQFNFVYTYCGVYPCVQYSYEEASPLAVLYGDGWYDNTTGTVQSNRDFMRNQIWWGLSSGSRGYIYGDQNLISWNPHTDLATVPFTATDMGAICAAYAALPGWNKLVPDTGSALVTAGRGTPLGLYGTESGDEYTGYTGGSNVGGGQNYYVTASVTPDGELAVIYIPDAASAITVNGSLMASGYTAQWMDPVTGTLTSATIGSTYSHSAANSQSAPDWVLVLQGP